LSFLRPGCRSSFLSMRFQLAIVHCSCCLDGHSTHYQPHSVHFAKEHGIIMLCLPPHTTQESQPQDFGVFGPLISQWSNACHRFFQRNPGKVVTKNHFSALFRKLGQRLFLLLTSLPDFEHVVYIPSILQPLRFRE